jgi:hypothetical protein
MEKTLNDTIEGFFRGIVFIIFSSIATFGYLMTRPLSAPVILVSRLYRKDREQVRPYVFLFLALLSIFLLPALLGAGTSSHDVLRYKYYVDGEDLLERSFLGKVFDYAVENFEAKALLPIIVAAVVGVCIFHVTVRVLARLSFATRFRRSLVLDSVFFLCGAQVMLAVCAWIFVSHIGFGESQHANWITSLLEAYRAMSAPASKLINKRWIYIFEGLVITWILALPIPTALRLVRKSRWGTDRGHGRRLPIRSLLFSLGFTLYVDLVFWMACTSAGLLGDRFSSVERPPYQIKSMECKILRDGTVQKLVATILVTVTGKDAWEFSKEDFQFFVSAERLADDPKPKLTTPALSPKRIGHLVRDADALEPNDSSRSTLVEPGRWKVFKVTAPLNEQVIEFLRRHPTENRCTISDKNDNPAGYIAPLIRDDIR